MSFDSSMSGINAVHKLFEGRIALVTGGTDGIGKQVALRLASGGAQVIVVGRSAVKGAAAVKELCAAVPDSTVTFQQADLSLMRHVVRLAESLQSCGRLDVVVHCAGVMLPQRTLTADGLETVFAVQYLARLLLTQRLLSLLEASASAGTVPVVVNVSAGGVIPMPLDFNNLQGEKFYNGVYALCHESVANDMLVLELQARYPQMQFYNYGPGYVRTTLLRDMPTWLRRLAGSFGKLISISPEQAADDIISLLISPCESGLYGRRIRRAPRRRSPTAFKSNSANRARLWQISQQLIAQVVEEDAAQGEN